MVGESGPVDSGLGARGLPTWPALMGALGSAEDRPEVRQQRRAVCPAAWVGVRQGDCGSKELERE
jgi:hypothetical protein